MTITKTEGVDPQRAVTQQGMSAWARFKSLFKITEFVIFLVVILLLFVGWLVNPNLLASGNLKIMTRDIAILGIAAIGVGFPIITSGIDLSVGSMVGFGGVMAAYFMKEYGWPIGISVIATLILGALVGVVHGLFVTKLKMHGFLITLVTMGMARGFILLITESFPITGLEDDFKYIGQGYLYDIIPIPVVICLVLAVLTYYLLRYTYIGRQIYASGGNVEAARYSGVNVDRRIILAYTISVVCAVIVGMIQAARLGLGHPGTGEGYELLAIAACILGGYSLLGGEGTIPGVIVGAMLIGVLQNEMVILKIDPYWHKIIIYTVLAIAITIDYARRGRRR
ncbi:MAG: ABC transporter permease [Chloroflexi bacterium]|nr:ABC transporter permease [Chloroflexota bacterium]